MSRNTLAVAFIFLWIASAPAGASVFSHELSNLPDVPNNLAEKAIRAIYPGPVQWVFGMPETKEGQFVSFVKRVRSFFAAEHPASRHRIVGTVEQLRETRSTDDLHRDWDHPLPVPVSRDVDHHDVLEIFLGVDLQVFLSRLFSAVIKINEDWLTDRREREREGWRDALFGGGAAVSGAANNSRSSYNPTTNLFLDTRQTPGGIAPDSLPGDKGNGKFKDKSVLAEVRETILGILTHPLLIVGLLVAALFAFLRRLHEQIAPE